MPNSGKSAHRSAKLSVEKHTPITWANNIPPLIIYQDIRVEVSGEEQPQGVWDKQQGTCLLCRPGFQDVVQYRQVEQHDIDKPQQWILQVKERKAL